MIRPSKWDVQLLPMSHYDTTVHWTHIETSLAAFGEGCTLDLDPDFQRAHVWTEDQQRRYVEYILAGGEVGRNITWNCPDWPTSSASNRMQLVDGKQRLEAVRKFIRGDLEVYGQRFDRGDRLRGTHVRFTFRVCSLPTRAEVLRLYLNINAGGTPHTPEELCRVRLMLIDAESGQ